ncbi:MAG: hypothetical protein ACRD1L_08955, partial [Terriglobales bacterium]
MHKLPSLCRTRKATRMSKTSTANIYRQELAMQAEVFLAAIRERGRKRATRILRAHPEVARVNIFAAAAAGEAATVQRMIRKDRGRVHATHGREACPPLAYACGSPLHKKHARQAEGLRRVVTLLLRAGASANSFSLFH